MAEHENEKPEVKAEKILDLLDVPIGEDKPQVSAKTVVVEQVRLEEVQLSKEIAKKVVFCVRHPDIPSLVEISGARYQVGDKLRNAGLWFRMDEKTNTLPYKSATACVLRYHGKQTLNQMKGEQIQTVADDSGYLLIKAY